MAKAKKSPITNKWDIQIRYKDSFGNNKKTTRRGFNTKKKQKEQLMILLRNKKEILICYFLTSPTFIWMAWKVD